LFCEAGKQIRRRRKRIIWGGLTGCAPIYDGSECNAGRAGRFPGNYFKK